MPLRSLFVLVHRYVGLAMAVFLVVAGLTGTALAYYYELDAALNPSLYQPKSVSENQQPLDIMQLRQQLQEKLPEVNVHFVPLDTPQGQAVPLYVTARDRSIALENDEYFMDPYSGSILGQRKWGDLTQGSKNVMPFLYQLHHTLALGETGSLIFGVVAVLWSIDCFVGAYLTFPPLRKSADRTSRWTSWWKDWGRAWLFKTGSLYKLTFTWHRAAGLWLWAILFVFAWSAVGLTLHDVYYPVMHTIFPMKEYPELPHVDPPREVPGMAWKAARDRGRELIAEQAEKHGFRVLSERRINYDSHHGVFRYQVASTLDINNRYPSTTVWFDSETGELRGFVLPTSEAVGNTITTWINALHFGAVWGRPYQAFVAIMGIAVAGFSISGVYLWWVKFQARRKRRKISSESSSTQGEH